MIETQKKRTGRKRIKADIPLEEIERLAAKLTKEQIAARFFMSYDTYRRREKERPEMEFAFERGRSAGVEQVADKLFEMAVAGDRTSMIFYLKARGGWREVQPLEVSGPGGSPLAFQDAKVALMEKLGKLAADSAGQCDEEKDGSNGPEELPEKP